MHIMFHSVVHSSIHVVRPTACLSVHPPAHPSIHLPTHPCTHPSFHSSMHPSVHPSGSHKACIAHQGEAIKPAVIWDTLPAEAAESIYGMSRVSIFGHTAPEKKRKNAHLEAEAGRGLCWAGPSPGSPRPKSLPAALADPAGRG